MRRFLFGSVVANLASFPLAAVIALLFRFPIPFGGYVSGADAMVPALSAAMFYGMLGGWLVQGVLGGMAAVLAAPNDASRWTRRGAAAVVAAAPAVLLLAVSDWIIGPW